MKQRLIKDFRFRAFHNGKMIYFTLGDMDFDIHVETGESLLGDPIMQDSGLLDDFGNKIFQGDILETGAKEDHVVRCDFEKGCFVTVLPWEKSNSPKTVLLFRREMYDTLRVVGNIYENPELIEQWKVKTT